MSRHDNKAQAADEEDGSTEVPSQRGDTGKLFVGGLNWTTTDESLRGYFELFGPIETACIMKDSGTGRSRGFGFVVFQDPSIVREILNQQHQLDGKMIDPKRAVPRAEQERTEKLFVAGIPANTRERDLINLFSDFGHVLDATIMADRTTGKPRGFGFVTFQDSNGIERALDAAHNIKLSGKMLEVKRAMPKGGRIRPPNYSALTSAMVSNGAGNMASQSAVATSSRVSGNSPSPSDERSTTTTKVATIIADEIYENNMSAAATASRSVAARKQSKQYVPTSKHTQLKMNDSSTYGPNHAVGSILQLPPQNHHALMSQSLIIPPTNTPQYVPLFAFHYVQTPTTSEASGSTRSTTKSLGTGLSSVMEEKLAIVTTSNIYSATAFPVVETTTTTVPDAVQKAMMSQYPAEWHHVQSTPAPWMPIMPYTNAGSYMTITTAPTAEANMACTVPSMMPHSQPSLVTTPVSATFQHKIYQPTYQQQPLVYQKTGGDNKNDTGTGGSSNNSSNTGTYDSAIITPATTPTLATPTIQQLHKPHDAYRTSQSEFYFGAQVSAAPHHPSILPMYPIATHYPYLQVPQPMVPATEWQSAAAHAYHPHYQQQYPMLITEAPQQFTKEHDNFALAREC